MQLGQAIKMSMKKHGHPRRLFCLCRNKCRLEKTRAGIIILIIFICAMHIVTKVSDSSHYVVPVYATRYHEDDVTDEHVTTEYIHSDVVHAVGNNAEPKTKVLLMTHMRGGSSLLGEMFNQNPEAVYWFEPFDGVFSDLYGSRHGWFPIDLLYDDNDRLRLFTDFEEEVLLQALNNLIKCNISALPTDTIAHYATTHIVQKRFIPYSDCLKSIDSGTNHAARKYIDSRGRIIPPWTCKAKLSNFCPRHFSTADKMLLSSFYCLHVHGISPFHDMNVTLYHEGKPFVPKCEDHATEYREYATCMLNYRQAISGCIPILEDICRKSTIVGIKAIRLRADLVQRMLVQDPELKLVYQMRDPRGIVPSRRYTGLLSELSKKNITKEASLLCQRMSYDISIIYNIEKQFPGRLLKMTFEELALDPEGSTNVFYQFLGREIPEEVTSYLTKTITSSVQGDAYSTSRKNGTDSVLKWQRVLKAEDIIAINRVCLDVLEQYAYTMLDWRL